MFSIGDKVKVIEQQNIHFGKIGTILKVNYKVPTFPYRVALTDNDKIGTLFREVELELLFNKVEEEDKVDIPKDEDKAVFRVNYEDVNKKIWAILNKRMSNVDFKVKQEHFNSDEVFEICIDIANLPDIGPFFHCTAESWLVGSGKEDFEATEKWLYEMLQKKFLENEANGEPSTFLKDNFQDLGGKFKDVINTEFSKENNVTEEKTEEMSKDIPEELRPLKNEIKEFKSIKSFRTYKIINGWLLRVFKTDKYQELEEGDAYYFKDKEQFLEIMRTLE